MRTINLNILSGGLSGITKTTGAFFIEAAKVALQKSGHQSGVVLSLEGAFKEKIKLIWEDDLTQEELENWVEQKKYTEYGAVALSLLIVNEFLPFDHYTEAAHGTGVDYFLGNQVFDEFSHRKVEQSATIEISGILQATKENTLNMRIGQKKKQMRASKKRSFGSWISIVEFSTPKSKLIKNE